MRSRTGRRINELNSIRWADVDLDSDPASVTISGLVMRRKGEGLKWEPMLENALSYRTLPMTPAAVEVLKRRRALRKELVRLRSATDSACEFVSPTPRRLGMPDHDAMKKSLRRTFDAAGFPDMTLHSIRQVVKRRLEEAGLSRAKGSH
nr:tyrosine-type recombinase/integrase [Brachybacterium sp. P6-10-X1]